MQVKPVLITLRIALLKGCPLSGAGFSDSDIPDVYLGVICPAKLYFRVNIRVFPKLDCWHSPC